MPCAPPRVRGSMSSRLRHVSALALAIVVYAAVWSAPGAVDAQAVQHGGAYHVPRTATDGTGVAYLGNAAHMLNGLTRKNVYNETQLREAMSDPFISEIWLMRNVTLSGAALPALKELRRLTVFGACVPRVFRSQSVRPSRKYEVFF